jgi:hypothetical protein
VKIQPQWVVTAGKQTNNREANACGNNDDDDDDDDDDDNNNNITNVMLIIIILIIIRNVVHETYDHTGNNWNHRHSNKRFKEKFGIHSGKPFSSFPTTDSYTRNIAHSTGGSAV